MKFSSSKKMQNVDFDSSMADQASDETLYEDRDESEHAVSVFDGSAHAAAKSLEFETDHDSAHQTPMKSGRTGQVEGLTHIGKLIHTMLALDDWKIKLLQGWPTIMGGLVEYVRLEKIDRHIVVLGVYDSSWMQELRMIAPSLIKAMNDYVGQPCVRELKFKAQVKSAKSARTSKGLSPEQSISGVSTKTTVLRPSTPVQRAALEKIEDEQLRSLIEDFFRKRTSSR